MPVADLPVLEVVSIEWPDDGYACTARVEGGCPALAVWWTDCDTCGHTAYACEPHRVYDVEWGTRVRERGHLAACLHCGAYWIPPREWQPLR